MEEPHKVAKETTAVVTNAEGKSPKHVILSKHKNKVKKRKAKVKKETIDYSSLQKHSASSPTKDTEALTKVQKWLLSSPQPSVIPKSKSIPLGLTERAHRPVPKVTRKTRPSKSASNLLSGEKTRLQVVFKPPFRFSVKICKSDKTKVVLDKSSKPDVDRKHHDALPQPACPAEVAKPSFKTHKNSHPGINNDNNSLPKTETTNQESGAHGYENLLPRSASDCKLGKKIPDLKIRTGHKKSNSVGQNRETTESRQNLISNEDFENTHVYENVLANQDNFVPKSCSMPRRQTTSVISRQSSYGHLPRAQMRPQRHSTNNVSRSRNNSANEPEHFYNIIETLRRDNSGNANTCRTNTSSSSGSSGEGVTKVLSKSSRQNSLIVKPSRSSLTDAPSSSKLTRQLSEVELQRSQPGDNNLRGFQLVVGKDKLKRQLSDNALSRSRLQLAMPMSAGAEPRAGFCWSKRAQRTSYTFGDLKHTVPNCTDAPARDALQISPEDFLKIIDN